MEPEEQMSDKLSYMLTQKHETLLKRKPFIWKHLINIYPPVTIIILKSLEFTMVLFQIQFSKPLNKMQLMIKTNSHTVNDYNLNYLIKTITLS